ncbi:MAG TPA: hypothetical protein VJK09_02025 [Candidatus Paceibacterota bacterium]
MSEKQSLKLGDAIAKLTKALHIPHCEKCERRRQILNEIRRLGVKETSRKLLTLESKGKLDKSVVLKNIIKKLEDCCD